MGGAWDLSAQVEGGFYWLRWSFGIQGFFPHLSKNKTSRNALSTLVKGKVNGPCVACASGPVSWVSRQPKMSLDSLGPEFQRYSVFFSHWEAPLPCCHALNGYVTNGQESRLSNKTQPPFCSGDKSQHHKTMTNGLGPHASPSQTLNKPNNTHIRLINLYIHLDWK